MPSRMIVVTGASGFIGSWVISALAAAGRSDCLIGVGRRRALPHEACSPNIEYRALDLLRSNDWTAQLPSRADVVVHLAGDGRTRVPPEEQTAQWEANVSLTTRAADYAQAAGAGLFLCASSVYVYSGVPQLPFVEERLSLPVEPLGATKLAAESLVHARACAGAFRALALRIFTAYGPRAREGQFIPEAIRKLQSAEPIAQFRSPQTLRDFVYVEDVAAAFVAAATFQGHTPYEAVNIGSGTPTSIREVVELLAILLDVRKPIEFMTESHAPSTGGDHWADLRRSAQLLGWRPLISLADGLRRTVEFHLAAVG